MSLLIHKGVVTNVDKKSVQVSLPEAEIAVPNAKVLYLGSNNRVVVQPKQGDKVLVLLDEDTYESYILGFIGENPLDVSIEIGNSQVNLKISDTYFEIKGFLCKITIDSSGVITINSPIQIKLDAPLITANGYPLYPPATP